MSFPRWRAAGLALTVLAAAPAAALAHPRLVSSTPAAQSRTPPVAAVELRFSEALEPRFSTLTIAREAAGGPVAIEAATATAASDPTTLVARPKAPLAPGAYRVHWRVTSVDTHHIEGDFAFTVK